MWWKYRDVATVPGCGLGKKLSEGFGYVERKIMTPNSISEVHWFNKTALKQGLSRHSNINLDLIKASVLKST